VDILIADQDAAIRGVLGCALLRAGFGVREAGNGADALEAARADSPQLVLLDVALPDICGYLVCKALRDEFGEAISIVLLSDDRTDRIDRTAGLLIGADDCIAKPVVLDELLARVRRLTARTPEAAARPRGG
jgi:two-component system, OmpR family, response regulator